MRLHFSRPNKVWQLGDVGRDAACFVFGQQIRSSATPRLILGNRHGQRLTVVILDDEAGIIRLIDGPWWREAL